MPASVRRARLLGVAVVAVMAVRALATVVAGDDLVGADVDAGRLAALALTLLVVLGGLLLVSAARFARGDNWARMLAVVVGGVCVLGGLLGVQQDSPAWHTGLNLVIGAIAAWLVVTLFHPESNAWFGADRP